MNQRRRMSPLGWATIIGGCGCAALVAVIVVVLVVVISVRSGGADEDSGTGSSPESSDNASAAPESLPEGADYLVYGASEEKGAPVVDLHTDYMCPYCGTFHEVNAEDLDAMVEKDEATIRVHPRTFLDAQSSGGDYSTRAANAVVCTYEENPDSAWALDATLWAEQPEEGSAGLGDEELIAAAHEAGATDSVDSCITEQRYATWLHDVVEEQGAQKAPGTPAIFVDGTAWGEDGAWQNTGELRKAVEAA